MLYATGNAFLHYPFRVVWLKVTPTLPPVRVMVGVSKKRFKSAVKRNSIKRQMREIYRLHKQQLIDLTTEHRQSLHISIQYVASEQLAYDYLTKRMKKVLHTVQEESAKK